MPSMRPLPISLVYRPRISYPKRITLIPGHAAPLAPIRSGSPDHRPLCAMPAIRLISQAAASAICCLAACLTTTTWPPAPHPMSFSISSRAPLPWALTSAWCWSPAHAVRQRVMLLRRCRCDRMASVRSHLRWSPRLPPSAPTAPTPMAAIPTRSATPPAPKKTCAAAISPSMACCSIRREPGGSTPGIFQQ